MSGVQAFEAIDHAPCFDLVQTTGNQQRQCGVGLCLPESYQPAQPLCVRGTDARGVDQHGALASRAPSCFGDVDADCVVGISDLLVLLGNWTV